MINAFPVPGDPPLERGRDIVRVGVATKAISTLERTPANLVFLVDVSGSMDMDEHAVQRRGYVEAFLHPEVIAAVRSGPSGRIAVAYVEWAIKLGAPGAVIVVDNIARNGRVLDPADDDRQARAVRDMFEMIGEHPRLEAAAIQTVGTKDWDGFAVAIVKALVGSIGIAAAVPATTAMSTHIVPVGSDERPTSCRASTA